MQNRLRALQSPQICNQTESSQRDAMILVVNEGCLEKRQVVEVI